MDAGWQWVPPRGFARADEPVVLEAARPGRFRRRMVSDDFARQPPFYHQPGGFLIPDDGLGMQRSRSIGHRAPPAHPPVVINNFAQEEVPGRGRPISVADDFMDIDDSPFSPRRFREHSRPRGRAATSREPSPFQWQHEMETEQIKKELEVYKKKEERKAEEERIKNELLLQRAKEEQKKRDDEAKRKIIEEQAVVEWQRKERERIEKEKQEKEKRELEYKDRLQKDFGLTETQVAKVVTKENNTALDLRRTTHTKIARRHISLETLRVYDLPYQLDDYDPERYVVIKRWVPEHLQERLWEHTRRIREDRDFRRRRIEMTRESEEQKAKLMFVKKKVVRTRSPGLLDIFR